MHDNANRRTCAPNKKSDTPLCSNNINSDNPCCTKNKNSDNDKPWGTQNNKFRYVSLLQKQKQKVKVGAQKKQKTQMRLGHRFR